MGLSTLVEAVTTFNQDGYEKYGERFLETFKKHWHGDILLTVYAEGMEIPYFEDGERIRWPVLCEAGDIRVVGTGVFR